MESKNNNGRRRGRTTMGRRRRGRRPRKNQDASTGASAYPGVQQSNQNTGMSIRSMPLFGQRTKRTVQYATQYFGLNSGTTVGAYVFSANGLFDPDITGTGHQPMGFDQMMIFYNHYTVNRSRIRVQFAATNATAPNVALAVSGSATPLTTPSQIMEVGRISMTWATPAGVADSHGSLQASCNLGRFQGLKKVIDDPDMRGDASSNPAEQVYYIVYVWNPVDSTATTVAIQALIEYETYFHEPKSPTQS